MTRGFQIAIATTATIKPINKITMPLSLLRKVPVRQLLIAVFFLLVLNSAHAQVSPIPFLKPTYLDNNGHPLAGGRLFTYAAGTNTNLATYSDALGTVPNADPVILDAAGRAFVFLGSNAYKFVLQNSLGQIIWTIDNITSSNLGLLTSNNIWSGTNTWSNSSNFNGPVFMSVGLNNTGPSNLIGGGSLVGSWGGNPNFSGIPNFSGGFTSTTGTFSQQIISTLPNGTAPFVISSSTVVTGLNADLLESCNWAITCPIGTTTPNSGQFTVLTASTSISDAALTDGCVNSVAHVLTTAPCTPTAIQSSVRKPLTGNVNLPQTTLTTVDTQSITMPATGCPCRVMINYSYWVLAVSGSAPYVSDFYVTDGATIFAASENSNQNSPIPNNNVASDVTGTYANAAVVVFTVKAEVSSDGSGGAQVRAFGTVIGTLRSYVTLTVLPSL